MGDDRGFDIAAAVWLRFNARKVQAAGAGWMGKLPDFTPAWLTTAMAKQPGQADCARALGARIRAYGGAEAAITAIEGWTASFSPRP